MQCPFLYTWKFVHKCETFELFRCMHFWCNPWKNFFGNSFGRHAHIWWNFHSISYAICNCTTQEDKAIQWKETKAQTANLVSSQTQGNIVILAQECLVIFFTLSNLLLHYCCYPDKRRNVGIWPHVSQIEIVTFGLCAFNTSNHRVDLWLQFATSQ